MNHNISSLVNILAIQLRNGQVLVRGQTTQKAVELSVNIAGKTALEKAGDALAKTVFPKALQRWQELNRKR